MVVKDLRISNFACMKKGLCFHDFLASSVPHVKCTYMATKLRALHITANPEDPKVLTRTSTTHDSQPRFHHSLIIDKKEKSFKRVRFSRRRITGK